MRLYLTLLIIFCAATQFANAQNTATDLKFDQRLANCEKKWVVFPLKTGETRYAYGFVYVDEMAGFTFDLKGFFTVDDAGHYSVDTSATKNGMVKYRLSAGMADVAPVPANRFAEMHLQPIPAWVKNYYRGYTDTLMHNFRMGFNLNAMGECSTALTYLEPLYKKKPDYPGLIFELAYAYNDLSQAGKAVDLLNDALKKDSQNARLYRELGYAYMKQKDTQKAIKAFTQGIEIARNNDDKSEMAYNLAMTYKDAGQLDDYKNWMIKAKSFTTPNSRLYNAITSQGF